MNLPTKIKQDSYNPESRKDEIIGTVNSLISFLEEKEKSNGYSISYEVAPDLVAGGGGSLGNQLASTQPDEPKEETWSVQRQNLLVALQKFKGIPLDILDSAYLAGLEASQLIQRKEPPHWESDYAAIWYNYDNNVYSSGSDGVRQDILELIRRVAK